MSTDDSNVHDNPRSGGYTLATGAPKEPTKADLLGILMVVPEIEEACRIKWDHGVLEHRGGDASLEFQGDPLAELHSEGIDALNLISVLERDGTCDHESARLLWESAMNIVQGARNLNRREAK